MTSTRRRGELERVVDHCRAVWVFCDVPEARVEDMAAELEAHLRQRLEDGGSVRDVVGADLDAFAVDWAGEERVESSAPHRLLRWATPPTVAVAVFLVASHVVSAVRGDGWGIEVSASTSWMLLVLVVASTVIFRPRILRWLLAEGTVKRAFAAGAVAWLALVGIALVGGALSRALDLSGAVAWPWPLTAALAAAGILLTALSHRTRPRPQADPGGADDG